MYGDFERELFNKFKNRLELLTQLSSRTSNFEGLFYTKNKKFGKCKIPKFKLVLNYKQFKFEIDSVSQNVLNFLNVLKPDYS